MKLYAKGKHIEIIKVHKKLVNGKHLITVMVGLDGEYVVTYPNNPKLYLTNQEKARELWAKAQ